MPGWRWTCVLLLGRREKWDRAKTTLAADCPSKHQATSLHSPFHTMALRSCSSFRSSMTKFSSPKLNPLELQPRRHKPRKDLHKVNFTETAKHRILKDQWLSSYSIPSFFCYYSNYRRFVTSIRITLIAVLLWQVSESTLPSSRACAFSLKADKR